MVSIPAWGEAPLLLRQSQACQILECWGQGRVGVNGLAKLRLESTALPHIWGIDGLWVPYNVDVHERVWGNRGFPVGQRQGMRVLWSLPDLPSVACGLELQFHKTVGVSSWGPGFRIGLLNSICASSLEFRASTARRSEQSTGACRASRSFDNADI